MQKIDHPLYTTWKMMLRRCDSPKADNYANYGGRGITVCDKWRDFWAFVADVGERPEGKTLDRIHNDGPYEPGNVRWSTRREQMRNTRRNHTIDIDGRQTFAADLVGVVPFGEPAIRQRIKSGASPQEVMSPVKKILGWTPEKREKAYAKKRAQTHCKRGHELSGDNLIPNNHGRRICRICVNAKSQAWRDKIRAQGFRPDLPAALRRHPSGS